MNKEKLKELLEQERKKYKKMTYDELAKLEDPTVIDYGSNDSDNDFYQIEIGKLEENEDYIHISISLSDNNWYRGISPLVCSVIVNKDKKK